MPNFFDLIDMPDVLGTPKTPSENDKKSSEDDGADIMRLTQMLTSSLVSHAIADELERLLDETHNLTHISRL